jgi:SAM-dependent methyltransferase
MTSDGGLSVDAASRRYEAERAQGDAIAAGAEAAWGWGGAAGSLRAHRRAAFIAHEARLAPGVRCLELGAGTGEFTARLLASGCELTAVELSETTAAVCRERLGPGVEVIVGNIETGEGLEGREFDAVVGVSVLHHVNLPLTLEHTFSKLRSGGRFAFSEPNMANPQVWAERHVDWVGRRRHVTPHETAFRTDDLRAQLETGGLVVEVCEPFEFLHPATPRALMPVVIGVERVLERTPLRRIAGSLRVAGSRP